MKLAVVWAILLASTLGSPDGAFANQANEWARWSVSPVPIDADAVGVDGGTDRIATARCGPGDARLREVARAIVERKRRGEPLPAPGWVSGMQRMLGEPHPWARVWAATFATSERVDALAKLDQWLDPAQAAEYRRCGAASAESTDGLTMTVVVIAVDALADLTALPTRARTGQWLTVEARLRAPARGGQIVLMGPSGAPRTLLSTFDGTSIRASVALDEPGDFVVQVIANLDQGGPRPVLEADVFADVAPSRTTDAERSFVAVGERTPGLAGSADALAQMLTSARQEAGLGPLDRDGKLDALASRHAERMARAHELAHNLGDGDPADRLRDAGLTVRLSGENVARAASVAQAHRLLWASPSHRANMLRPEFARVGLGVARGDGPEVWVVELFASD